MNIYWQTQEGIYGTAEGAFTARPPDGAEIVPLYTDTSNPDSLILADREYLRQTVAFYGFALGDALKTRLEKIRDIQAEYDPLLTALQAAKAGAEMRDDTEGMAEIKAEYMALLQEKDAKIQGVPNE